MTFKPFRFRTALALMSVLPPIACVLATSVLADAKLEGTNPAQWRLIWQTDPAHTATLSWTTAAAGTKHFVQIRDADGKPIKSVDCHRNGAYAGSNGTIHFHHARLTELKPATKYFVVMQSDESKSPEFWFITAPSEDKAFSLIFGGDSRSNRQGRRMMNQKVADLTRAATGIRGDKTQQGPPPILAFAHGGDYILTGTRLDQWIAWLSDHELTATKEGRLLPIIPARGNHDGGPLYNEIFDFPAADRNYFAINLGPQVRFITLNTETSTAGDQRKWLAAELAASRPKNRWVLAQYHQPAFPAVKGPSSAKQHWVPLFEKYNLDLACEADGHSIKRTVPIRKDKHDPTGIVYIGEGGLGAGQRRPKKDRWFLQPPGYAASGHHVQVITFSKEALKCRVVMLDGSEPDTFTLKPRGPKARVAEAETGE